MNSPTTIEVHSDLVIEALRQKLSDRDYENAILIARNKELEIRIKEVTEMKLSEVNEKVESLKEGVKSIGD